MNVIIKADADFDELFHDDTEHTNVNKNLCERYPYICETISFATIIVPGKVVN